VLFSQILNDLSLTKDAVIVGEDVINIELKQVSLALTCEDLTSIDLSHALIVAPVALFDYDTTLEHFETLARDKSL